MDQNNI